MLYLGSNRRTARNATRHPTFRDNAALRVHQKVTIRACIYQPVATNHEAALFDRSPISSLEADCAQRLRHSDFRKRSGLPTGALSVLWKDDNRPSVNCWWAHCARHRTLPDAQLLLTLLLETWC